MQTDPMRLGALSLDDLTALGRQSARDKSLRHSSLDVRIRDLPRGKVHRDGQLIGPGGRHRAGLAQDPRPDLKNMASGLRKRDELKRVQKTATGVLPAQQSLEAGHAS